MASAAVTPSLQKDFKDYIEYLALSFPCPYCRPHIKQRLASSPLENVNHNNVNGKNTELAKWSWEFHNSVNGRKNKSQFPWEQFKKVYL